MSNIRYIQLYPTQIRNYSLEVLSVRSFLLVIQFIISLVLIAAVLMQQSKGEGLGSIGGSANLFHDKVTNVEKFLNKVTIISAVIFIILSVILSVIL